ncbi:hypothetical protein [Streptomyces sp. AM 2-1-1]|uniref:hypothetical protein n=1 Tax=Streptomyces sp. AM 2-1-1 TaxID=3028709 RepID=UPI0023BA1F6E|nr:hypothetical protein [Streptomyces sp. AM 2-1-1]WEH38866.1 hypothetical protein PZB77_04715 [Streptomyces sp. AM 2-1-1]
MDLSTRVDALTDAPAADPERLTAGGPAHRTALTALREGWGREPAFLASGGSIPLVNGPARAAPGAEVLLLGAEDNLCDPHAPNERGLFCEPRSAVIAETAFPRQFAAGHRTAGGAA